MGCAEIYSPNGRPQPSNVGYTRKADIGLNIPASEAEFIPTLNHATLVVQIMGLLLRQGDDEGTIRRSDCCRIIPFQVVGCLYIGSVQGVGYWKIMRNTQ